jgi:hypothetical protein
VHPVRPADPPAKDLEGPRRFRYGCATALTLVGSLVLCCGLVITQYLGVVGRDDAHPPPTPTLAPITGSAALLTDGVTIVYSDGGDPCRDSALGATESGDRVVLALSETDYGAAGCVRAVNAIRPSLEFQLSAPLGTRSLIDKMTGAVVPCFDMRRGLTMPPGPVAGVDFTPSTIPSTSAPYFGGSGTAVLVQTFGGRDSLGYQSPFAWVKLIEVTATDGWHPPPTTVTTPVTVRGRAGRAAAGIIVWNELGLTIGLVGAGPPPPTSGAPNPLTGPPLSTDELVVIAAALQERAS